jgi:4-hydroxy-2-oxoheptanedioate aldolase
MRYDLIDSFRTRIGRGPVLGPFSKTTDPAMVEVMGLCGFDFVIIDLEHGPHDVSKLGNLIRAAEAGGLLPIVRVRAMDGIGPALDLGAGGVQIPHVSSAEQARRAVEAARFAPVGHRGVCRYVRAARHSVLDRRDYFSRANTVLVIAQVEGREGIEQLEAILEVEGIDIVFVGVYDLSQSVGRPGEVDHPQVQDLLERVCTRCRERGRVVGTFVEDPESAMRLAARGVHYLCYGVDIGLFARSCSDVVQSINARAQG